MSFLCIVAGCVLGTDVYHWIVKTKSTSHSPHQLQCIKTIPVPIMSLRLVLSA